MKFMRTSSSNPGSFKQQALHSLARWLEARAYEFITVTPETHRRVLAQRAGDTAQTLRDVFGWNLDFDPSILPAEALQWLRQADAIAWLAHGKARSRVRFATLHGIPYIHSAYPTGGSDAVFFGPDTYRFVALIERELQGARDVHRVLDVGCGAGAGGLAAARFIARATGVAPQVDLVDINPLALDMARTNAATFGIPDAGFRCADLYEGTAAGVDLIVANPPYLLDDAQRLYRHGGGASGSALSERIVREGIPLLAPGGKLVLYTGSAIQEGKDAFRDAALGLCTLPGIKAAYRELDPDIFGEELERESYRGVERIAAVALVVERVAFAAER